MARVTEYKIGFDVLEETLKEFKKMYMPLDKNPTYEDIIKVMRDNKSGGGVFVGEYEGKMTFDKKDVTPDE